MKIYENLPYRHGVGIVLFNKMGKVWIGQRVSYAGRNFPKITDDWQFPQGGIELGEDPELAARRELYEETGIKNIKLLAEHKKLLAYDFPANLRHLPIAQKYRGQQQHWFAYLFFGDDSEIAIDKVRNGNKIEFANWRWEDFSRTLDLIVDFKKSIYQELYNEFAIYIKADQRMLSVASTV